ncbi:DinB family protein [Neptunitalea lumnitzerae]|uniref:DinB family protein n=1 Tax=Neptunitalea lumnitzerae TaxID=2965509 RepID=A0ABQ5MFN1_9FLAO|nr:DinB family protein [Neptunitalea sp. Y10]GLB48226.1 hypothetical protein Y10_05940 [Neptunitalea sp. Y10]
MKKLITLIALITVTMATAQDKPLTAWQEKWTNSEHYLLEIAEAMPANHYSFKPTEREMSFAEQLVHIANNINWLSNTYFKGEKVEKYTEVSDKEEIISLLKAAFSNARNAVKSTDEKDLSTVVDFFAGPKTKLQILNLLQDHVTHHRGQIIVYLNLNNVAPPRYSGW